MKNFFKNFPTFPTKEDLRQVRNFPNLAAKTLASGLVRVVWTVQDGLFSVARSVKDGVYYSYNWLEDLVNDYRQASTQEGFERLSPSRRHFLNMAVKLGAGALVLGFAGMQFLDGDEEGGGFEWKPSPNAGKVRIPSINNQQLRFLAGGEGLELGSEHTRSILEFLSLANYSEKERREVGFLNSISEEIETNPRLAYFLTQVIQTRDARTLLFGVLDNLLKTNALSGFGLSPVATREAQVLEHLGVPEITLASAKVALVTATNLMKAYPEVWLERIANDPRRLKAYQDTLGAQGYFPAYLATAVSKTETGGGLFIGSGNFRQDLNVDRFHTGYVDMIQVGAILENLTGIPYLQAVSDSDQTPLIMNHVCSKRPSQGAISGGAVWGQFMPVNQLYILKKYEECRAKDPNLPPLLPGTPFGMMLGTILFIYGAMNFPDGKDDYRFKKWPPVVSDCLSYTEEELRSGNNAPKGLGASNLTKALRGWNPNDPQIRSIISYAQMFA